MTLVVEKTARKPVYVDVSAPPVALKREYAIAVHHEGRFTRAFLKVSRSIYDPATLKRLGTAIKAMQRGELTIDEVSGVVDWYDENDPLAVKQWELLGASLDKVYTETVEDAGQSEVEHQGWEFRFTVQKSGHTSVPINPFSVRWVRVKTLSLVKEISDQQRGLLRTILADSFEQGERSESILEEIGRTVGLLEKERDAVTNRFGELAASGMGDEDIAKKAARYAKQLLRRRAKRIARTETVDAYAQGLDDSWQLAKEEGFIEPNVLQEWVELSGSPRTCKICKGLGGQKVPVGEPFLSEFIGEVGRPPSHPMCLPGDALILASGVTAKSERTYQGDLIVIHTASGNRLACTPNHPILRDSGWGPARGIQVGCHIVSSARPDWATPGVVNNKHHRPPVVQQISDFSLVEGSTVARRVPLSAEDFHGDAMGSKVAVIGAYRQLRDKVLASISQEFIELALKIRDAQTLCLDCLRAFALGGFRDFATANGIVGSRYEAMAFLWGRSAHTQIHGSASPARSNTGIQQVPSHSPPADAKGFAQSLLTNSTLVFADKVVNVDVQSFHGPVFNLETNTGAYIAQGIVTHNCRCTRVLVFDNTPSDIDAANQGVADAREALSGRL